jgi:hypothetical protein
MTRETSGDSSRGVSGFISRAIQDLFTTQGLPVKPPAGGPIPAENRPPPRLKPGIAWRVKML